MDREGSRNFGTDKTEAFLKLVNLNTLKGVERGPSESDWAV